jgi:hypothetical protein
MTVEGILEGRNSRLEVALEREVHRPEAEAGDLQSGVAEDNVFHASQPLREDGWRDAPLLSDSMAQSEGPASLP